MVNEHRRSIARGEEVFNNTKINITGVSGLNDDLNTPSIPGFCGTCHDSPNIGHHSVRAPLNIGVPDAGDNKPPVLDISGLPVFTITCQLKDGPLAGGSRGRSCAGSHRARPTSTTGRQPLCGMSSNSMTSASQLALRTKRKLTSSTSSILFETAR